MAKRNGWCSRPAQAVALVEAGQGPYPSFSFLSRFSWTVQAADTDVMAPAGHYSSNQTTSLQRLTAAQVNHGWGQAGSEEKEDLGAGEKDNLG